MAEFVLKKMAADKSLFGEFIIESSATSTEEIGNDIHRGTRAILTKYSIPFTPRRAVQLTRADYEKYDLFVGMDTANIRNMHRLFGADPDSKITKLLDFTPRGGDVADPWYSNRFDIASRDIYEGCEALLEYLTTKADKKT